MNEQAADAVPRQLRQADRRHAIANAVLFEGSVRIEELAERFGISLMTAHRDLDDLESQGILRKSRGVATASSTSLVESSDAYRSGRQRAEKEAVARACVDYIEPGQAVFLDDSTTVRRLGRWIGAKAPLTVITNALTLLNELKNTRDISMVGLGGTYVNWCSSFMGRITTEEISRLRADLLVMSTAAIVDDTCFHQQPETIDTKQAMFDSAARRILLADHTKFERRALHGLVSLADFDVVIVDWATPEEHVTRLRGQGVSVVVAPQASDQGPRTAATKESE
ncbi:MAG: DeoR/GlpR family DNA-binding transcription regulator [Bifidobacteriaceae bacterium]|jgi:DeoR/GlpR family transcriptional regulator of sugar metabolism|nr:DeoR/GlpR family DNA-binding transcription regulator [Bifidobacteriaceae bacterium]